MMKKLFVTMILTSISLMLCAGNVITYTATEKLAEETGLHPNAFNTSITSHTFSEGTGTITFNGDVTSIGEDAFNGCSAMTSIEIPNSVTSIGRAAFVGCKNLPSIEIPYSVVSIGYGAFYNCTSLTSVTFPNSVTSIGQWAFSHCI